MRNSNIHRWFGAVVALLLLIMPVLLADELSLFASWLLIYICWLIIIAMGQIKISPSSENKSKPKDQ